MHRFFLETKHINGNAVNFPRDIAHQMIHVLRLGKGDRVAVLDNMGYIHQVRLGMDSSDSSVMGEIVETNPVTTEPKLLISLFFGLSSREKVEWILQKGTEIGVSAFYPFLSSRTRVQSGSLSAKKFERWKRIIKEAAEQSGRGRLPELHQPKHLDNHFAEGCEAHQLSLIAWEDACSVKLALPELLEGFAGDSIALFVGPEGGFSKDEIRQAQAAGCQVVSLGARILRMETAALVFPALVFYELRT